MPILKFVCPSGRKTGTDCDAALEPSIDRLMRFRTGSKL